MEGKGGKVGGEEERQIVRQGKEGRGLAEQKEGKWEVIMVGRRRKGDRLEGKEKGEGLAKWSKGRQSMGGGR